MWIKVQNHEPHTDRWSLKSKQAFTDISGFNPEDYCSWQEIMLLLSTGFSGHNISWKQKWHTGPETFY
jgi:hypothetical protein